ncbi:Thyroid adenoma-associated protein [Dirofilaria immitis]
MIVGSGTSKCYSLKCTSSTSCFTFLFRKPIEDWFETCCNEHECFLIDACIPAILHFSQKYSSNTGTMLDISKALARLLIILKEKEWILKECEEDKLFDFVCRFWDYVSEAVCHDCVNIFESLMKLHLAKCVLQNSLSSWAKNVGKFLTDSRSTCRGRYRCILIYSKVMVSFSEGFMDNFCTELYTSLSNPTLVAVVSELIAFDIIKNFGKSDRLQLHSNLLRSSLQSPVKAIRIAVQDRLLPEFSKHSLLLNWIVEELKIFQADCVHNTDSLETLLYIAKFCLFHQKGNGNILEWISFIDESVVISALFNATTRIRLMAWSLICDHPKLTTSISSRQLLLCKSFIATNMAEQSPAVRLTILSGLKKISIRIRESGQNIMKNSNYEDKLQPYVDFIYWLRDLCFQNLIQYANFSRRIMALQMLEHLFLDNYLVNDNKGMFFEFLLPKLKPTDEQISRVICCLDDSYQLCQISALRLLSSPFFEIHDFNFDFYFSEMKQQMFSIRSLFTLTSSYRLRFYLKKNPENLQNVFQYLLNVCKDRIKLISEDFLMIATKQGFVYSILSAISVILELFQSTSTNSDWCVTLINHDLLPMCFQISELVAPVVNSMSPEGFIPDEHINTIVNIKDFEQLKESTDFCQALLASCWRSHKYVSAIFYIVITKWLGNSLLSSETVQCICNYYWRQLTECKHCGAIETAVEGFEALCAKFWSFVLAGNSRFIDLFHPEAWVKQIIDLIDSKKNILCATRRSAGLPHLLVSILVKEPITNDAQCLKTTMLSMLENGKRSYEAQVHSINIMRAIFSNSRLSELVLCYVEPAVNLCFAFFSSRSWAVRSAASQLFAALINRMFGIPRSIQLSFHPHEKNRLSSFEFFSRFPSLYDLLHRQFDESKKSDSQLRMFAVLTVLIHLFPSPRHISIYSLSTYVIPLLKFSLSCRAMRLRELFVAALISICEIQDIHFLLNWISKIDLTACTQNEICTIMLMLMELAVTFDGCELRNCIQLVIRRFKNNKCFERWCDYNRFLFLTLLLKIRYQFTASFVKEFVLPDAVLVFRPLAKWIAGKIEVTFTIKQNGKISFEIKNLLMNNKILRLEFWRALSKSTTAKFTETEIIQLAIEDIRNSGPFVQCYILTLFLNNTGTDLTKLFDTGFLKHFLNELIPMTRQNNRHLANLLLIKLDCSEWRFEWLHSSAVSEDQEVQSIAVRALELLLRKGKPDIQLCKIIVLLLKSENEKIREEVAELFSYTVNLKVTSLNPEILFWWFVQYHPEVEEFVNHCGNLKNNNHTYLFDACASNPYTEAIPICNEYLSQISFVVKVSVLNLSIWFEFVKQSAIPSKALCSALHALDGTGMDEYRVGFKMNKYEYSFRTRD